MSSRKKGDLGFDDAVHAFGPNHMKAALRRAGWKLQEFGRIVRCMDPLDARWVGTVKDAYVRQMQRDNNGVDFEKLPDAEKASIRSYRR